MTKRTYIGVLTVALAVVLAAGGLLASNMGFKLNYPLQAISAGVSASGTSTIALPDNRQAGVNAASSLMNDIGLVNVANIQKFIESSDGLQLYTGEGYFVKMNTTVNYIIVGSHDPSFANPLNAVGGGSASGTNLFSYPYHSTATTASALMADIGLANVANVQKFLKASDGLQLYTGRKGTPGADFALVPGEAYFVKMNTTVNYIPSHYCVFSALRRCSPWLPWRSRRRTRAAFLPLSSARGGTAATSTSTCLPVRTTAPSWASSGRRGTSAPATAGRMTTRSG
jgi:hypothetical protein